MKKYRKAIIVFDGYQSGPSTKDCAHSRRNGRFTGQPVHFDSDMIIQSKKEVFLSNVENKIRFLMMLSDRLQLEGCETHHAKGDADLLIVQTAIASAGISETVLVGDDTEL